MKRKAKSYMKCKNCIHFIMQTDKGVCSINNKAYTKAGKSIVICDNFTLSDEAEKRIKALHQAKNKVVTGAGEYVLYILINNDKFYFKGKTRTKSRKSKGNIADITSNIEKARKYRRFSEAEKVKLSLLKQYTEIFIGEIK